MSHQLTEASQNSEAVILSSWEEAKWWSKNSKKIGYLTSHLGNCQPMLIEGKLPSCEGCARLTEIYRKAKALGLKVLNEENCYSGI